MWRTHHEDICQLDVKAHMLASVQSLLLKEVAGGVEKGENRQTRRRKRKDTTDSLATALSIEVNSFPGRTSFEIHAKKWGLDIMPEQNASIDDFYTACTQLRICVFFPPSHQYLLCVLMYLISKCVEWRDCKEISKFIFMHLSSGCFSDAVVVALIEWDLK